MLTEANEQAGSSRLERGEVTHPGELFSKESPLTPAELDVIKDPLAGIELFEQLSAAYELKAKVSE